MGVVLSYDRGSLVLRGASDELDGLALPEAREDPRVGALRVPAHHYHVVVRSLVARGAAFEDRARAYGELGPGSSEWAPRDYQREAVAAWLAARRRGQVVLPTGTGKTLVAVLAIAETRRSALVVVPTLDLLNQWYDLLARHFGAEVVGAIGGGEFEPRDLTVTTYDSAYLHLDRLGDRFGLLVFDEVHHLGGPSYVQAARMALAPFRLGLTATPPDDPARASEVEALIGPVVFRREISEMAGDFLSPYDVVRLTVALGEAEQAAHDEARARYRGFVERHGLRLGGRHGWTRFLEATNRSPEGRAALAAWREQRRIAMATPAKLERLAEVLDRHRGERVLVFTHGNDAAYAVSRRFLAPAVTHQTKGPERRAILQGLREGTLPVVVTSRVLNEGVDVPAVGVGVVLSGTATVREHVQRLGRLLRKVEGKRAVLYEVVTEGTSEESASARRREHDAYR